VNRKLVVTPRSVRDLNGIRDHIAADNPRAAERFVIRAVEHSATLK
jgi:plasmid stabilization system protein ParE